MCRWVQNKSNAIVRTLRYLWMLVMINSWTSYVLWTELPFLSEFTDQPLSIIKWEPCSCLFFLFSWYKSPEKSLSPWSSLNFIHMQHIMLHQFWRLLSTWKQQINPCNCSVGPLECFKQFGEQSRTDPGVIAYSEVIINKTYYSFVCSFLQCLARPRPHTKRKEPGQGPRNNILPLHKDDLPLLPVTTCYHALLARLFLFVFQSNYIG